MKCRKHQADLSSISGVCASCLRERLLIIIQAQVQAQTAPSGKSPPNLTRRKSDSSSTRPIQQPYNKPRLHHSLSDQRFYNSPQIAITTGGCIGNSSISTSSKNKNLIRFSSFSNLFKSNSKQTGDPEGSSGYNSTSVTSSPSWKHVSHPIAGGAPRKRRFVPNRGVSPARSYEDGESIDGELSEGSSEFESAESTSKPTMQNTPVRRLGGRTGSNKSVSGLIFCLSPLVRPNPNKLWNIKGKPPLDGGATVVPSLSYAKSFVANRSRKLADFGRPTDPNR